MTHKRVVPLVLLTALLAIGLCLEAGCGDQEEGKTGDQPATIKIGAIFPTSGELAQPGKASVEGLRLAIDEVNAAGGIASLGGAKIELVVADSQGSPDKAVSEMERLASSEGVSAVVGTYQSTVALPVTQWAERLQVPVVISIAVADEITERGFKYTFRLCPQSSWYARDQIRYCQAMKGVGGPAVARVALLHEDTDYGQSTSAAQKEYAAEAGIEVVGDVTYPSNSADLTTQVSKVKAMKPDVVLTSTYLNDAILIMQAREKLGIKTLFFDSSGGTVDGEFIKRLGSAGDGTLTELEFTDSIPGVTELNANYKAKYGSDITSMAYYAYQAGWVIADALERAATADPIKVRDALAATNISHEDNPHIVTSGEKVSFGTDGQNPDVPLIVIQYQDGKMIPVYPEAYATAPLRLP